MNNNNQMEITEKVKTHEDACAIEGVDPVKSLPYAEPQNDDEKALNAVAKLIRIARVLNEGWKPDWKKSSVYKYYPWFYMNNSERVGSGLGFSFDDYDFGHSASLVGSRLCFKSRELAEYAGKQFEAEYRDYMVIA